MQKTKGGQNEIFSIDACNYRARGPDGAKCRPSRRSLAQVGLISLENTSKTSLMSQTGFRFKIYQGMNSTAQVNFDWDNDPAPGVENTDTAYIFTLGYQF
jgi:hypothetical protein